MLDILNDKDLSNYLSQLSYPTVKTISKAGEGNMNDTLRVSFNDGSTVIVKQAKPYVAKYPDIPAPIDRVNAEATFFNLAKDLESYHPKIIHHDSLNNLIIMEDLGAATDMSHLYKSGNLSKDDSKFLAEYLYKLHSVVPSSAHDNTDMRKLNNEYIFELPFSGDLNEMIKEQNEELFKATRFIVESNDLKLELIKLSAKYLAEGEHLLHGDFYPASVLQSREGIKIIDAEFSFLGPKEWDVGIFCAHLLMTPEAHNMAHNFVTDYFDLDDAVDMNLIKAFAGTEILRRMIGVAQVDFNLNLEQMIALARHAKDLVLNSAETAICL